MKELRLTRTRRRVAMLFGRATTLGGELERVRGNRAKIGETFHRRLA